MHIALYAIGIQDQKSRVWPQACYRIPAFGKEVTKKRLLRGLKLDFKPPKMTKSCMSVKPTASLNTYARVCCLLILSRGHNDKCR